MGILAQPTRPNDPAGTCTHTQKYPYPEHRYGYFWGTGMGSPGITPGLPMQQPRCVAGNGQTQSHAVSEAAAQAVLIVVVISKKGTK